MSQTVPAACLACDSHLVSLAYDEVADIPKDCVAHLQSCARCADELASLKSTRLKFALPLENPSDELDLQLLAAFDAHHEEPPVVVRPPRRWRRWGPSLAAAAGLSVVAVATVFLTDDVPHARDGGATTASMSFEPARPPPSPESASASIETGALSKPAQQKATWPAPAPSLRTDKAESAPSLRSKEVSPERQARTAPASALDAYEPLAKAGAGPAKMAKKKAESAPSDGTPTLPTVEAEDSAAEEALPAPAPPAMAQRASGQASPTAGGESLRQDSVSGRAVGVGAGRARRDLSEGDSALDFADEAARQGDYKRAAELYARIAQANDSSALVVSRALVGQARALLALKRLDDAAAVAYQLTAESDDRAALISEIEKAASERTQPSSLPVSVPR